MPSYWLVSSVVSDEKAVTGLFAAPLYITVCFSLAASRFSLCLHLLTLIMICLGVNLFEYILLGCFEGSRMYRLKVFIQFEKHMSIMPSNILSLPHLLILLFFFFLSLCSSDHIISKTYLQVHWFFLLLSQFYCKTTLVKFFILDNVDISYIISIFSFKISVLLLIVLSSKTHFHGLLLFFVHSIL